MTVVQGGKSTLLKLWPFTQQHRLVHKSLSVLCLYWRENERTPQGWLGVIRLTNVLLSLLTKKTCELMVKKNAAQMAAQKDEVSKLRAKVMTLEKALDLKGRELQREEKEEKMLVGHQAGQIKLEKLQKVLGMRERELGHIKGLASSIVEQRTELEQFFHQSLAQVKQEIEASRLQYKKEALQAYRWRLREATAGKLKFPPIRTFRQTPHSTNSVYSDMEAAATWWVPLPHHFHDFFCVCLCDIFNSSCLLEARHLQHIQRSSPFFIQFIHVNTCK